MPFSAGLRHARIALSPISRHPSASIRISPTSPYRSLHALHSSPLRPIIDHPRLYDRSSTSHYSTRKWAEEHEHKQRNADIRAPGAPLSGTNAVVSGEARQLFMKDFMAWVDEKDPAPVWYTLQWWLRHIYEAAPTHRITLTMPDEASCEAARHALKKVCNRWDGWVGALRTSYVCIVVGKSFLVDYSRIEVLDTSKESKAASSDAKNFNVTAECIASVFKRTMPMAIPMLGTALLTYLITNAMVGNDEPQDGSDRKQEQHHGESHNNGESRQKSAPEVRCGHIRAGGDVYHIINIYNLLEGNPLSSSSPTVGNEQLSGNKDLREKK